MDFSPRLSLPYIAPQQAQKQVTYNEAMQVLDCLVQPVAASRTTTTPPGAPTAGDTYIVPAGATGAWAGRGNAIAVWRDGAWSFVTPAEGWLCYVIDTAEIAVFGGSAWAAASGGAGTSASQFGINATADTTNRLAVGADASLFSHDGADHRLKINKSAASDTASLIFQAGTSGRAELGLAGDNHLRIKVSANGSSWTEALRVDNASGLVELGGGQLKFPATANPSSNANTLDDYEEGSWTPTLTTDGTGFDSVTYDPIRFGVYTKIGNLVFLSFRMRTDAVTKGAASGNVVIGGLPFTPSGRMSLSVGFSAQWLGENPLVAEATVSGLIYLSYRAAVTSGTLLTQVSDVDTAADDNDISISGCYQIA